jgi:hypothetical protein
MKEATSSVVTPASDANAVSISEVAPVTVSAMPSVVTPRESRLSSTFSTHSLAWSTASSRRAIVTESPIGLPYGARRRQEIGSETSGSFRWAHAITARNCSSEPG